MKKAIITLTTLFGLFATIIMTGCYEPSPLYGTWADNQGNTITFINDGTFTAKIYNDSNEGKQQEGSYVVIENTLSFSLSDGSTVVTEWDIRGSLLYLTWSTGDTTNKTLTLYHTAK